MIEIEDLPNGLVAWTHTVEGRESYGIASDLEMALLTIEKGKEREDEKRSPKTQEEPSLQRA